ncbi:MAG: AAA family ATPase [Bacteroidota bacterium]
MKKLPIGIQNIQKILSNDYLYVDKTQFAYALIQGGAPYYFLSRPRRFGKSLFLSTLEAIFKGDRALFKDCAICQTDYDWQAYPVVVFDFYTLDTRGVVAFEESIKRCLQDIARSQGITITTPTAAEGLQSLIKALFYKHDHTPVVVLIDEYDKPIVSNLENLEEAKKMRELLSDFFGMLKSLDAYLRFTFTTGVSKFAKVSLFSGPNNLKDISMHSQYVTIMGYTEQELKHFFAEHIQAIAQERGVTKEEVFTEVRHWYNGYRFSHDDVYVYNPFSTLNFLDEKNPQSYWYTSGTPSFLIDQLTQYPETLVPLAGITATKSELMDASSVNQIDLKALMFQTGYLTIKGYHALVKQYTLAFPNREVQEAFIDSLVRHFAPHNMPIADACYEALVQHQPAFFFDQIKADIAAFPYSLFSRAQERTYHMVLLGIIKGMGLPVAAEVMTNRGRIDLLLDMLEVTYILELKLNKSPEEALQQIHEQGYYEPYLNQGKKVGLLGVNFSSKMRNVADWRGVLLDQEGQEIGCLCPEQEEDVQ